MGKIPIAYKRLTLILIMRNRESFLIVFFCILTLTFDWNLDTAQHLAVGIAIGACAVSGVKR